MKTRFSLGVIPKSPWQIDFDEQGHERFYALNHKVQQQILEYLQIMMVPYLNLQRKYSHRYVNNASWPFTCSGYRVSCNLDYERKMAYILDIEPQYTQKPLSNNKVITKILK